MPLYVKDQQVDALAEQLAALRGTSKTEAVRQALQSEIAREKGKPDLVEQSIAFVRELRERAGSGKGRPVEKAFIDGLYEDR
ncbi:type II toxin-antitoxin system VapB family antitoxin (plasmid) [Methylobacterium radiotolerans]